VQTSLEIHFVISEGFSLGKSQPMLVSCANVDGSCERNAKYSFDGYVQNFLPNRNWMVWNRAVVNGKSERPSVYNE